MIVLITKFTHHFIKTLIRIRPHRSTIAKPSFCQLTKLKDSADLENLELLKPTLPMARYHQSNGRVGEDAAVSKS